jgi:uncharacterized protein with ATP-grasp and redox domains
VRYGGKLRRVLHPPPGFPPRIRTDSSNPFAHHTMAVRVPAIIDGVLERNPDYSRAIKDDLARLRDSLAGGAALPALESPAPGAEEWRTGLAARTGEGWLSTDWFFAETYAYRNVIECVRFWETRGDPFRSTKRDEYASETHADALERALSLEGSTEQRLHALLGLALFGNRIDLSFRASLERGTTTDADDVLADDRESAVNVFLRGEGPLHVVCDNAGTELTLDLVLADFVLTELRIPVALHVKLHPTFVSDATADDLFGFAGLRADETHFEPRSPGARVFVGRLRRSIENGKLDVVSHAFWNGPAPLWELPWELERDVGQARLVVLKGDANYRRAVNDAVWPPETPFAGVSAYCPAPLLALRTLKSDPIVGLPSGRADELDRVDPTWRVNGKRGVASLGGRARG